MRDVVVTKSPAVVVGPSEPGTPTGIIELSSFDKGFLPIPTAVVLMFDEPIDDPVKTIKKALSRALVPYHPMAGRLVAGAADDDAYEGIACTGEGVSFVAASASCALEEGMMASPSAQLLKDLTVGYPADLCRPSDALLLMQVTEFSCGGFAVGVTWNHIVADGAGIAQFLQAVGEVARGMGTPSVVPVRLDPDLPRFPPLLVTAMRSQIRLETDEGLASVDVTIPSSLISRVKAECDGECTLFKAVAAVLWRCRTRAIFSGSGVDPDAPAMLSFPMNVRGKHSAKRGYYGNCFSNQLVMATVGSVCGSEIKDLVKMMIQGHTDIMDVMRKHEHSGKVVSSRSRSPRHNYNSSVAVSSWRNLGLEATDLGRGKPARVTGQPATVVGRTCIVCPPCKGKDGVNVLSRCVTTEHVQAFLGELASLGV